MHHAVVRDRCDMLFKKLVWTIHATVWINSYFLNILSTSCIIKTTNTDIALYSIKALGERVQIRALITNLALKMMDATDCLDKSNALACIRVSRC